MPTAGIAGGAWGFDDPGAWIVAAIVGLSVLATALFVERLWALRAARVMPRAFVIRLRDLVAREQVAEAMTACRADGSPSARVLLAGLGAFGAPRERVKEQLEEIGRFEALALLRGTTALAVIARVTPLMGLFGTVWGMIDVFAAIEQFGVGDAGALAGGIRAALYTTFAGLSVAIPASLAHAWIEGRAGRRIQQLEELSLELLDALRGEEPS